MQKEFHAPKALEDFLRNVAALYHTHKNNSKIQTRNVWNNLRRKYNIKSTTTEPYHSQQNPFEWFVLDVKL